MSEKPLIGVTATSESHSYEYTAAVERAGGEPWLLLPDHDLDEAVTLSKIQGLLLSGGSDLGPQWYGTEATSPTDGKVDTKRDATELRLLSAALKANIPVLGICRGMQALNVATGGTLIRDIPGHKSHMEEGKEVASYHRIFIAPGSKLAAIIGAGGFVRVNSLHHHAVREPQKSPNMLASAYSLDDGIIEAIESQYHDWVIGVQFHPERRKELPRQFERLFQGLVYRSRPTEINTL